jgi:AraC-like DNA-binding protein
MDSFDGADRSGHPGPAARRRVPGDVLVHLRHARDHLDRHFAEAVDLERVAAVAGLSKYHFHRLFTATYGVTPRDYLTRRRVERAQDLLRATNLTVTEVCFAVGYSSLGSFSARFKELVGETPSAVQRRYARSGSPRIPGCFVFMRGLVERPARPAGETGGGGDRSDPASGEKHRPVHPA